MKQQDETLQEREIKRIMTDPKWQSTIAWAREHMHLVKQVLDAEEQRLLHGDVGGAQPRGIMPDQAQQDADKRDAERYRWLREHTHLRDRGYGPSGQWLEIAEGIPWVAPTPLTPKWDVIDAAIDAARKEAGR